MPLYFDRDCISLFLMANYSILCFSIHFLEIRVISNFISLTIISWWEVE